MPSPSGEMVMCVPQDEYTKFIKYQGIGHIGDNNPLERLAAPSVVYLQR